MTRQEFDLLEALARRPGEVLSREQLVHLAWDIAYEARSNVVDVCVKGVRDRIDRPFGRRSLQTVRGLGYRLVEDLR
jgi:two-component system OmpR family response regulator